MQEKSKARIGVLGLGVMGSNLAMNIAEKGFDLAVYNREPEMTTQFMASAGELSDRITSAATLEEFVAAIEKPRAILLMITAGKPVDMVTEALTPLLDEGDMIIDAGNANFHNTRRREAELRDTGLKFFGMGVSGGAEGARHGPSMMIGGDPASYERIRDIIEAIAAKHDGQPCADHFGPDGAGHFVKTVHNGIEYADMQMIAEVYGLLRDGAGWSADKIGALLEAWDQGALKSYLVEISAKALQTKDPETGAAMVDVIVDQAGQKGTGRWTAIEAISLGQSPSTIEAAVAARAWSSDLAKRAHGQSVFENTSQASFDVSPEQLEKALLAAKLIAYDQGFSILDAASKDYGWGTDLAKCAEVWREGCIIRSSLLDEMASAIRDGLPEGQLIFAPRFETYMIEGTDALRACVANAALLGLPVPAFANALAYFDTMRQARGTTNLVQAQRDFFGAHGFTRLDGRADQHGPWHG